MRNGQAGVIALSIVGGIILLVGGAVVASALNLITIPWLKFDSQVNMERGIVQKTYNADNALYNYHWFQERAGAMKALEQTINQSDVAVVSFEVSAGQRKDWTFEDKNESARLRAVAQGQKAQYNSLAQEYNARANEVDRTIFKDELPTFFSLKSY